MRASPGILVVGGSLAALRFAEAARRAGVDAPITVLGEEPHLPYNRPPLSKAALHDGIDADALAFPLRAAIADVEWRIGTTVNRADVDARTVTTADGELVGYETLVAATGLRPRRSLNDPAGHNRVHALRTIADARRLRSDLGPGRHLVIVGGGFIGCEVAATARALGTTVTLVCADTLPLRRQLHDALAARMLREHRTHGVEVLTGTSVVRLVAASNDRIAVELSDGVTIEADVIVEATGSIACTDWLSDTPIDTRDGVLTDTGMRALRPDGSIVDGVFAIGDVARFPNPLFDDVPRAVGHWNLPAETARRAADVVAAAMKGGHPIGDRDITALGRFAPVPSFWSDQYDVHLLAYGLIGLATSSRLVHGTLDGECVVEYWRDDMLVAVCGIGLRSVVMAYRDRVGVR